MWRLLLLATLSISGCSADSVTGSTSSTKANSGLAHWPECQGQVDTTPPIDKNTPVLPDPGASVCDEDTSHSISQQVYSSTGPSPIPSNVPTKDGKQ